MGFVRLVTRRWYLLALVAVLCIGSVAVAMGSTPVVTREATRSTISAKYPPFARVRTHAKLVALTFDDGPDPLITPSALKLLEQMHGRATFFVTGMHALAHQSLVRLEAKAGEVENHTFDHPHLALLDTSKVVAQLASTQTILQSITGKKPRWVRPPYGEMSRSIAVAARSLGLPLVRWDAAIDRFARLPLKVAVRKFLAKIRPGSIILAHDACPPKDLESWCVSVRMHSLLILRTALKTLRAQGWQFVTISELAAAAV